MKGWMIVVAIVALGALAGGAYFALQRQDTGAVVGDVTTAEVPGIRTIEVFLPATNGRIVRETREILGADTLEEDVRHAIEELMSGGDSGLRPIPESARLLNVFADGSGELTLNFDDAIRRDHPGGSEAEVTTLRCLVSTVAANFAAVDRVRLLVDGEIVSTLAGHVRVDRPLAVKDYR